MKKGLNSFINVFHIGFCPNNLASGVAVAIPAHLKHQAESSKFNVSFLNLCENNTLKINNVKTYQYKDISETIKILNEDIPDIVIFHEIYRIQFLKISKILRNKKIPYIIIPHGGLTVEAQNQKKLKKILGNFLLFNKYIKNASGIQFLSESEKKRSLGFIKNQAVMVSGNGMGITTKKYKYHLPINMTYIGRYDIYFKGLDILLPAIKKIHDNKNKDIIINLYGTGDEKEVQFLKDYIMNNNLSDICKINGPVFLNEKKEVLKITDVFIQTSRSEGQPLGIIEALANAIPVIVTPGTGLANAVKSEKMGYECELTSEDIYDTILKCINEKDNLEKMSENAIKYAQKNYDWEMITEKNYNNYKSIIGG